MLENVLFLLLKTFTHMLYILCKQLFNTKSKRNREESTCTIWRRYNKTKGLFYKTRCVCTHD